MRIRLGKERADELVSKGGTSTPSLEVRAPTASLSACMPSKREDRREQAAAERRHHAKESELVEKGEGKVSDEAWTDHL